MEKDERLLPLPEFNDLQTTNQAEPSQYAPVYDDEFSETRSFQEYWNVVYKRLPIILALTILTTTVVAFYMYRQPSIYEATTEMIIEPRKPKGAANQGVNINFGNNANYYNTQLQLLKNPELMREVVIGLNLQRDPNLFNGQSRGIFSTVRSIFSSDKEAGNQPSALPTLNADDAAGGKTVQLSPEERERADRYAGTLLGGLRVTQVEGTNLVNISMQSTNPTLAAKTADMVAEVFIREDIERESEGGKRQLEDLNKSIEELKANIATEELQLIDFMRSGNLSLAAEGSKLSAGILEGLSSQLQSASDDRLKIEARYKTAVTANARGEGASIPDLTESRIYQETIRINTERKAKLQDTIRDIEKQISQTEAEKAQLLVKYQPEYFAVREKDELITKLQENREKTEAEVSQIIERDQNKIEKDAVNGALVGLRSQLESAQGRENQLRQNYLNELSKANVQGVAETQLTTKKREIETNRGLLDTYVQQQKQLELSIASSQPDNLKISNNAVTPGGPIGPNRSRNILVALLVSLAAGIGLAFLLDYLDDSIKTSDDIGRNLGLPTLAVIPFTSGSEKRKLNQLTAGKGENEQSSLALIATGDKRSAMVEAYRHLRTSLLFSSAGRPPQTILVTSSQPSEGKTTTAINTAITLAQSGAEVLIIDCDLRRPRLHKHFGVSNAHGLTSYLSNDKNPESLIQNSSELLNLKVITSGPIPPNPSELLSSNEMKNLLQYLKGTYKHIVIDSPPAIFFTDAAILSMIVDGVVLVTLAGKSSIYLTRRFKQRLGSIGARIYGVVLNGVRTNSMEYNYYGYGYSSYYTTDNEEEAGDFVEEKEDEMFSSIGGKR